HALARRTGVGAGTAGRLVATDGVECPGRGAGGRRAGGGGTRGAGGRLGAADGRDRGRADAAGGGGVAAEQPRGAHRTGHVSRTTSGGGDAGIRGTVRG